LQPELLRTDSAAPQDPPSGGAESRDLPAWLSYLERLHSKPIDLGLDRVREVHLRMPARRPVPVITVGGTNGKGSTCAYLEAILRAAGYRTGCYTSPHLLRYNERIRVDGIPAADAAILAAFEAVELARAATPLTYFEFGTLAALHHFEQAAVDVLVLEVGLGGRLDAVNIVEPDCAVVTSVALDHMEFLGPDRESIAREKAGIFRGGRPAVFGQCDVPETLRQHAGAIGADLLVAGEAFRHRSTPTQWHFDGPQGSWYALPYPALRGAYQLDNAACALMALASLQPRLPVALQHIREGLVSVDLPARLQVLPGRPVVILDVAHNPHAAEALAGSLARMGGFRRTLLVLGMLHDKDIAGVTALFSGLADRWHLADLPPPRGAAASELAALLAAAGVAGQQLQLHADPGTAIRAALAEASEDDRVIAFGSFLTIAAVMTELGRTGTTTWGS
jgi:dihydrofolate synthase/folylpolyglutamate synthase